MQIIDGDGHTVEPPDLWVERMDQRRWGDWIPRSFHDDGLETWYVGGVCRAGSKPVLEEVASQYGMTAQQLEALLDSIRRPGGYDPAARLADMDLEGMDAAVVYPTRALFFGPLDPIPALHDVAFVADCLRAYNDWAAEFCSAAPKRLFAIAGVPLQDVELAVREAERAVGLGLRGVFLRPSPYVDERPLSDPVYDRFWAACQDLDVPVAFHPGVHVDTPGACRKFGLVHEHANMTITNMLVDAQHGGSAFGQAIGNTCDMMVTVGRLLMGGVCERFPRLRFLFLESGGGWIGTLLQRMDEQVKAFPLEKRWLHLLPSEYFRRQCWIGFEPEEWNLAATAEYVGADRILWASDYPHPDIEFPGAVRALRTSLAPLGEAEQRKIAGDNAVRAYRLPL
ncbi:MAG TPA: amidohydrolase family protein [Candidatus Binatia bacterium]|nr:amidohydrolase family protein [Candidatus Binatia bacterium]